jgi:hypothetical protein
MIGPGHINPQASTLIVVAAVADLQELLLPDALSETASDEQGAQAGSFLIFAVATLQVL